MQSLPVRTAGVAALLIASSTASAAVIINNSTPGYYNAGLGTSLDSPTGVFTDPFPCANVQCGDTTETYATAPNLAAAATPLGTWLTSAAPTGGSWSPTPVAIPATWAVNTETAISYAFGSAFGYDNVKLRLGVDNGIFVWLNGSYLFGARRGPAPRSSASTNYRWAPSVAARTICRSCAKIMAGTRATTSR
jgi:hypothetical protein